MKTPQNAPTAGTGGGRPGGGPAGRGPGGRIEKPRDFRRTIGRLLRYFGREWPSLLVVSAAIIGASVLQAIAPARLGAAITHHIEQTPDAAAFVAALVVVVALYVATWVAEAVNGGFMNRIGNRLVFHLRRDAFRHLQTLSMSFFERRGVGDIISRVTNDIEMIYNALTNGFANLLGGLISIFGITIAMVLLDLRLSIAVVALLPVMVVLTGAIGRLVRKAFRENQAMVGELNSTLNESITAMRLIKSLRTEAQTFEHFRQVSDRARATGARADIAGFLVHPMMRIINGVAVALVVAVGGYLSVVSPGSYSIGLITAFIIYSRRFFEPLRQVTEVYNLIQSALAGAERVFEVLDTPAEITNAADAVVINDIAGDVEFRNVSFGYLPDQTVIRDVSLHARSGQVVAIVGPTGAGKTTLVNLLSRFYDVRSGSILIDGRDIRSLDIDSMRTRMGVVLQEPYFFADTILANIKYGSRTATDADAMAAAETADADHFIRRLPEGYNTLLAERGANISEGERQLLAIARAILANPRILVLDEATSSVDSLTEATIQNGLLRLMKGRTSFIIAHRLSTIRNADQVVVLHDHAVIEQGTHDQLMAADGFYARLYRMQFEKPEITEDMTV